MVEIPKPYLERNQDIVRSTELLLATPENNVEQQRSGTWATIRFARKMNKSIIIIDTDGIVMCERTEAVDFAFGR